MKPSLGRVPRMMRDRNTLMDYMIWPYQAKGSIFVGSLIKNSWLRIGSWVWTLDLSQTLWIIGSEEPFWGSLTTMEICPPIINIRNGLSYNNMKEMSLQWINEQGGCKLRALNKKERDKMSLYNFILISLLCLICFPFV